MLNERGVTLIELMIILGILSVIVTISSVSYQHLFVEQSLSHVAKQVYYTLQLAKTEAVKRNQKIYVKFCKQQQFWRMGMSDSAHCDCFSENSCQLDGVNTVKVLSEGKKLFINDIDIKFTDAQASYGPLRFSVETGSITFTNKEQKKLSVIQSAMRIRICSPEQASLGYKKC